LRILFLLEVFALELDHIVIDNDKRTSPASRRRGVSKITLRRTIYIFPRYPPTQFRRHVYATKISERCGCITCANCRYTTVAKARVFCRSCRTVLSSPSSGSSIFSDNTFVESTRASESINNFPMIQMEQLWK